ncbi:MAG: serine O-acetyltransferase [Motiliproteus sp.]
MFAQLREDIQSVFDRDPAARNTVEVMTSYPGLHAILYHRVNHWLWKSGFKLLARIFSTMARWLTGIEIHPGATIGRRFFIDHGMGVVIGETAVIGDDVTLYHGVTLGGTTWDKGKRHPTLGNGVVVGAGAKILGPFLVGANARIGSNAVVTKEVPAGATVIGIPGRVIRKNPKEEEGRDRQVREMADKLGFDAYGVTSELPDPVAHSIKALLNHMHAVDTKIDSMCQAMQSMGADYCNEQLPELKAEDFEGVEENQIDSEKPMP